DPNGAVYPLASELREVQDVRRAGAAAIDDEVGVLGRNLGAADPFAAQPGLLDQSRGQIARRILPDEAGGGQGQRLRGLLLLEARADLFRDLGQRPALQPQPAADEHGAGRQAEPPVAEGAGWLELAERAVGMQIVDGTHEGSDPAIRPTRGPRQLAARCGSDNDPARAAP